MIGAIRLATRLPIYVMIRPRGGSFHFTPAEVDAMVTDAILDRLVHWSHKLVLNGESMQKVAQSPLSAGDPLD